MIKFFIPILWLTGQILLAQTLLNEKDNYSNDMGLKTDFGGFVRGVAYAGRTNDHKSAELKSIYGNASFTVKTLFGDFGKGFAEVRIRKGYEFGSDIGELDLREAYAEFYPGKFEISLGQQIVSWGKADGFNPTNNITPRNTIIRSPDTDDMNMGNFLFRVRYQFLSNSGFEAIWIPKYKPSVLPWNFSSMPEGVRFTEGDYPDGQLQNSSVAFKFNMDLPSFDFSVSWFSGFGLDPGITIGVPDVLPDSTFLMNVVTKAYREQITGFDFSTTLGKYGLRGEVAWRLPENNYGGKIYVPNPDLWYIFGIDRSLGNVQIIAQYIGRYVIDFKDIVLPEDSLDLIRYSLEEGNRMFFRQQYKWSHSASLRISSDMLYQTLTAEVFGMLNFTTREYVIIPKLTYSITDGLSITAGLEWYYGKENTLFDIIEDPFNSVFLQLKASF